MQISTNGLISFGTSFTSFIPRLFPISTPVIAPYWDDIDLRGLGELRYTIITPATNLSLCNQVNSYLTTSTGSSVSVQWMLWAYWYNVCPYNDNNCQNHQVYNYDLSYISFFSSLIISRLY